MVSGEPNSPRTTHAYYLDSASRHRSPYLPHSAGSCAVGGLSGWKRAIVRVQSQSPGLRPNPMFSLANSPVAQLDKEGFVDNLVHLGVPPANVHSRVAPCPAEKRRSQTIASFVGGWRRHASATADRWANEAGGTSLTICRMSARRQETATSGQTLSDRPEPKQLMLALRLHPW
jgi:hypothetical protein